MQKALIFLGTIILCLSCSTVPKSYFNDELCTPKKDYQEKKALTAFNALDDKYSLIVFKSAFNGEKILVTNDSDSLLNQQIHSDKSMGLAKVVRINRNYRTEITELDNGYSFTLDLENTKKGKYIYISKDQYSKKIKYEIVYSNALCGFK